MKIKAAVTHAQGKDFSIEEVRLSGPKSNEVLVKVVATGVCHTDAVARDLAISPYPIVLGHEVYGVQQAVIDASHGCIEIPQHGTKHSLNISVATGIVIWNFYSQLSSAEGR